MVYHLGLRTFVRAILQYTDIGRIDLARTDRTFFTKIGYAWVR